MAKEKFDRSKPHVNIGTIGHIDHGKTTLTAAITKVLSKHNPNNKFRSFDTIDNAPEERERGITISTSHVEYETPEPPLRARRLPGPRRLHQEHDHRRRTDGRGYSRRSRATDGPMPQTKEHVLLARQVGVPYIVVFLNKWRAGRRRRADRAGRDGSSRAAVEVRLPRRRHPDHPRFRSGRPRKRRGAVGSQRIDQLMEAVDKYIPQPERAVDLAVPDADRRHLLDLWPWNCCGRAGSNAARSRLAKLARSSVFRDTPADGLHRR